MIIIFIFVVSALAIMPLKFLSSDKPTKLVVLLKVFSPLTP
uniref:Uncharacterized protein n=1 Tax=Dulem virus 29 TaxID=3145747 RepID=A0AAU8AWK2_9CAUD